MTRHQTLFVTPGVLNHCQKHQAFWVLDLIWSYQPHCRQDAMLRQIQFWVLAVRPDKTATIRCDRDSGDTAITQEIEFTDHPSGEYRFRWEGGVVMLPEER
jgi:hypothetical protein